MALADYLQLVSAMVGEGDAALEAGRIGDAIGLALLRYSADVPRRQVSDVGWLVRGYLGPLPADWIDGSEISQAEYPIGQQPPSLVGVALYVNAGGSVLAADVELPAGAEVRLTVLAPHRLSATEDTIPASHREAVASYAAHSLCRQLATRYSGERETAISADGSNTDSRARNYAARAREYRANYYAGIGKPDPAVLNSAQSAGSGAQPAAAVRAWPGRPRNSLTRMGYGQ